MVENSHGPLFHEHHHFEASFETESDKAADEDLRRATNHLHGAGGYLGRTVERAEEGMHDIPETIMNFIDHMRAGCGHGIECAIDRLSHGDPKSSMQPLSKKDTEVLAWDISRLLCVANSSGVVREDILSTPLDPLLEWQRTHVLATILAEDEDSAGRNPEM